MNIKSFIFSSVLSVGVMLQVAVMANVNSDSKVSREKPSDYVNPKIGTGGHGHTYPGATRPFGMVQLSPDTGIRGWDWCSGYHASDSSIIGFSHTHLSGTGGGDLGDILLMPYIGTTNVNPGTKADPDAGYRSRFEKKDEIAKAGYYSVILKDYGIKAELTTTPRAGFHKYTFPKSKEANIVLDLEHGIGDKSKETFIKVAGENEIEGLRRSQGWAKDQFVYFVAQFSKPIKNVELFIDDELSQDIQYVEGQSTKANIKFKTKKGESVLVKVGISAVSVDNARENLNTEISHWDFEKVVAESDEVWNGRLSAIEVEGNNEDDKEIFYTSMYHAMIVPNLFMDVNHEYRGMDGDIHTAEGFTYYTLFSLWDTFRATHPLYSIVAPENNNDFVKSMLTMYQQSGKLPIWELHGNETGTMIGYHSVPVIVDAILKGQTDANVELAYEAMKSSAMADDRGLYYLQKYGFIPHDEEANSVSKMVEYAFDDWCIAQIAKLLEKEDDYYYFVERAQAYKLLYDEQTSFLRGRDISGVWNPDFDPMAISTLGRGDYTEGNAWHYTFFAPQDVNGLIDLYGGKYGFEKKMDDMWEQEAVNDNEHAHDVTGLIGQYAHGNEPSHHAAYLYNYIGKPWKTQKWVAEIMATQYSTDRDGLSGNEDCGQMSSWYVLSAMGFYPVNPAQGDYIIGTPTFDKVTVNMSNGNQFVIQSNNLSKDNVYIQSAILNGLTFDKSYITHEQIKNGGLMSFKMGLTANRKWAASDQSSPVSTALAVGESMPESLTKLFMPYTVDKSRMFGDERIVELKTYDEGTEIFYTLDGTEPSVESFKYEEPIMLTSSTVLKAIAVKEGFAVSDVFETKFIKSIFKNNSSDAYPKISLTVPLSKPYDLKKEMLLDGMYGGSNFRSGNWAGIQQDDFEATIELEETTLVHSLGINFLECTSAWIFAPLEVEFLVSEDGVNFESVKLEQLEMPDDHTKISVRKFRSGVDKKVKFVRVKAKNPGILPKWHAGAGSGIWMFIDEIIIEG
ncbi:GH92 family glycosyl hydrolase [Aureibacter tunicatorum]|uniref:Alpha-1,2-mannosidase n=1 Tax=Aureibacter tunicatorum TaxID=866807 RepID=A0AAE3XNK2_9BACT|nr:GH92 family glycosyl hydrolase [Aureibacter tunicatorum]MDR6238354.1 putative alpha-1,2-mannosidase [Aureibacter tunicatorum]BDD03386.1 alpha-1 2-mannosidase [Aureibacter tunicatorum]